MPISVVCASCGKALKVPDDWVGKKAKCPGCKATFLVAPGGGGGAGGKPVVASKPGATAFNPNAAAQAKQKREKEAGSFSISPGLVIGTIVLVLFCVCIGAFIMGPKKVWNQWEALGDKPNDTVTNVVGRAEECYMQSVGEYNPRKGRNRPEVKEVMFFRPSFVMNMPDDVDFKGVSSIGPFKGVYHPKTGDIDVTVAMGGGIGIPGSGGKTTAGAPLKISGSDKDGKLITIVNGKKMELVMPPIDPNDRD